MAEITASAVKELREKTGLPMMDCKQALTEANGDMEKAIEGLRIRGKKVQEKQAGRSTSTGRIAVFSELEPGVGALIDIRCESAPVANNEHFIGLANDLAQQLAKGPGAATPDELLDQPSPSQKGTTLRQQFDDLNNRIREKFVLERILRVNGPTAGYAHHNGAVAVLLQVENAAGAAELARDICMHVAAMKPIVLHKEDVDPALVAKERDVLDQAMTQEAETIKNGSRANPRPARSADPGSEQPGADDQQPRSRPRRPEEGRGAGQEQIQSDRGPLEPVLWGALPAGATPCQPGQVRRQDDRRVGQSGRHEDQRFRALGTAQGVIACLTGSRAVSARPASVSAGSC